MRRKELLMDLSTRYLGLELRNPLVASPSPLNFEVANIRRLEDAGAAAVVLPSMFEEQIEHEMHEVERLTSSGANTSEASSYFPAAASAHAGTQRYLRLIRDAREAVDIPVIASLNGATQGGWVEYARLVEDAGASAIELNVYLLPTEISLDGREVEARYLEILRSVKRAVSIPVAVKLAPYFSSIGSIACELERAGADGLVLFNRFYQPDIDLARLRLQRDLELSSRHEIRLPLLWIGVLSGRLRASLAASTGVETSDEVVKYLLAGAHAVMTTSALLRHGVGYMKTLVDGLAAWLRARGIGSVSALRGRMSHGSTRDPVAFERANYVEILRSGGHL
jgi:dihydroorotate dehydrogenase (fumarate)